MSDLFEWVPLTQEQGLAMSHIRKKCDELYDEFMRYFSENSRYTSICKTKFEEFGLWAMKAMSREFSPKK